MNIRKSQIQSELNCYNLIAKKINLANFWGLSVWYIDKIVKKFNLSPSP